MAKIGQWGVVALVGVLTLGCAAYMSTDARVGLASDGPAPAAWSSVEATHINHHQPGAPTAVMYIDYQSRYAEEAYRTFYEAGRRLSGRMNLDIKNYPLNLHGSAVPVAYAMEAAERLDRFPEMADLLLRHRSEWEGAGGPYALFECLVRFAASLGIDPGRFLEEMDSPEVKQAVEAQRDEAEALDIAGAPAFMVDGLVVRDLDANCSLDRMIHTFEEMTDDE